MEWQLISMTIRLTALSGQHYCARRDGRRRSHRLQKIVVVKSEIRSYGDGDDEYSTHSTHSTLLYSQGEEAQ